MSPFRKKSAFEVDVGDAIDTWGDTVMRVAQLADLHGHLHPCKHGLEARGSSRRCIRFLDPPEHCQNCLVRTSARFVPDSYQQDRQDERSRNFKLLTCGNADAI